MVKFVSEDSQSNIVIQKERESLYQLLVPLLEAVAFAHLSRTSNAEPHAV